MAVFRGLFVRKDSTRGTQPAEARKALAGLLAPSSVTGARQGIFPAPGDPLKVTGTAGWTYQINGGHLASSRSDTDGVVIYGTDGTTPTPAVAAAPGSGSRWDLIYLRHEDVDQGGGETSEATLGVVSGVASGSPVKPTVPAGSVVVAEALVAAGATSTSHANVTITQVAGFTVARGGILPVRSQDERDALTKYQGLIVDRLDLGYLQRCSGSAWRDVQVGVRETMGTVLQAADAGGNVVVTHGLGATPDYVFISNTDTGITLNNSLQHSWCATKSATTLTVITYRRDTNAPFVAPNMVAFFWRAVKKS